MDITLEELFAQTNADPKTAIGYRRVSSLREKRKQVAISPEIQTEYIEAAAARHGITIVDWVDDMNISGRREQFLRRKVLPTIKRIRNGEADCVMVYNVSRWGRSTLESRISEAELWQAGGRLISATEPNDERSAVGKFTRTQLFAIAELQSDQIRESWLNAHRYRLKNQLPRDGRPRFGYVYVRDESGARYEQDPETAPLLARAYREYLAGRSLWKITREFRAYGVKIAGTEKLITYMVLRRALDSGFGAGKLIVDAHSDRPRYLPGAQQPVIEEAEWRAYRRTRDVSDANGKPLRVTFALKGLVYCGSCQHTLAPGRMKDGAIKLSCRGRSRVITSGSSPCPGPVGVRLAIVEDVVRRWIADHAEGTEDVRDEANRLAKLKAIKTDLKALRRELDIKRSYMRNLIRLHAAEKITEEEFDQERADADAEITRIEAAIEDADASTDVYEIPQSQTFTALLDGWREGALDVGILNTALRKVIRGIYVGRGKAASSPNKIDILGAWETREPNVFLGRVRGIDHDEGKHCSRCLEWKKADRFYKRSKGRDSGALSSWCRECQRAYLKEKYARESSRGVSLRRRNPSASKGVG